ncbi:hypothetical protein B0J18DRAFT_277862 [Chaetomium sp. MPI-SDFR-AT-0129]|nr:hypothetical protein B0J18DRAFT_277862 [Chaetomium sp. MPI-SDFR-AT-0129]
MDPHHVQPGQPAPYHHLADAHQEKAAQFQYQQPVYEQYGAQEPPRGAATEPTILSITRGVALAAIGVVIFLLVTVIGLSAGLGVSQRDLHQAQSDLGVAQSALSSASAALATAMIAPSSTTSTGPSSTSASATPTVTPDQIDCPKVNGTFYTASTGGKQFKRLCGVDYGGQGEAVDIGHVDTRNLDGCIDACAARSNCTGAGWGVIKGDKGPLHSCWMKTNLTKSHNATSDWAFAVLVKDN